jgi:hypothetical protein
MAFLTPAIDPDRLRLAFDAYARHLATLGQASVIAHLPMTVFLEEARRAGVLPTYRDPSCD